MFKIEYLAWIFLPILLLFQLFLGLIITSVLKINVKGDTIKKYLIFWVYGFVGSIILSAAVALIFFGFQKLMVFLFR